MNGFAQSEATGLIRPLSVTTMYGFPGKMARIVEPSAMALLRAFFARPTVLVPRDASPTVETQCSAIVCVGDCVNTFTQWGNRALRECCESRVTGLVTFARGMRDEERWRRHLNSLSYFIRR